MFLVDDILFSPIRGIVWVIEQIHNAVEEEREEEEKSIVRQLSELYMMLESGRMTEAEFDEQEEILLDRLDKLRAAQADRGDTS